MVSPRPVRNRPKQQGNSETLKSSQLSRNLRSRSKSNSQEDKKSLPLRKSKPLNSTSTSSAPSPSDVPITKKENAPSIKKEVNITKNENATNTNKVDVTTTNKEDVNPNKKEDVTSTKKEGEDSSKKRRKKKVTDEVIKVDLSCCKYEVLRIVVQKLGWQETEDEKGWHIFWTDTSIGPERLMTLRRGQKVNHFLGMLQICRKKSLARHLSNMKRMFPSEYKFFPRAFILPNHIQDLIMRLNSDRVRTYILKPDNGCQGRGVVLVQNVAELKQAIGGMAGSNMLAQKYLTNPMLLNGYKFDLRIYALVLSCDPLRLFLYKEGLVRFCTEKYMKPDKKNLKQSCMHLTNYAVNKHNANFEFNMSSSETDKGSKWTLSSLFKALTAKGFDVGRLKRQIRKMVVMTVISIVPLLIHNYKSCLNEDDNGRSCFELLGMDVLLDERCRPWLLEVNHSPSFTIDTPLDFKVKECLLTDTLRLLNIDAARISRYKMQDKKGSKMRLYGNQQIPKEEGSNQTFKETMIAEYDNYEKNNLGNYERIYPPEDSNLKSLYDSFLSGSEEIFKQSFDMKVKSAILKAQEIRKREEMEKEAAEKRKQKRYNDMRKKAQEAAKQAQQQYNRLALNALECNDAIRSVQDRIMYDMISPVSSNESPDEWERAHSLLDGAMSESNASTQNTYGKSRLPDTGHYPGSSSSSGSARVFQPTSGSAYGSIDGLQRLSSLPCIVPQVFQGHHMRKGSSSRSTANSNFEKIPDVDYDDIVKHQNMMRTYTEPKENFGERPFLSTKSCKLPWLRGSIYPISTNEDAYDNPLHSLTSNNPRKNINSNIRNLFRR